MQNDSTEPACLICGAPLRYLECAREMTCAICGKICLSNAECIHGHFVCDDCHSTPAAVVIRSIALAASEKDPFVIATAMMKSPAVHMHGPEHHILAGASLLAAYRNAGGELDLPTAVEEMLRRGTMIPGGFCGLAGTCGAAISAGMFYSIVTKTNPLSKGCKRDTYLALETTVRFMREHTGIAMEWQRKPQCIFSQRNRECLKEKCPYFPE